MTSISLTIHNVPCRLSGARLYVGDSPHYFVMTMWGGKPWMGWDQTQHDHWREAAPTIQRELEADIAAWIAGESLPRIAKRRGVNAYTIRTVMAAFGLRRSHGGYQTSRVRIYPQERRCSVCGDTFMVYNWNPERRRCDCCRARNARALFAE